VRSCLPSHLPPWLCWEPLPSQPPSKQFRKSPGPVATCTTPAETGEITRLPPFLLHLMLREQVLHQGSWLPAAGSVYALSCACLRAAPNKRIGSGSVGAFGEPTGFVDPLSSGSNCTRDIPYLQQLGVNTIRVYSVNSSLNHDDCMKALRYVRKPRSWVPLADMSFTAEPTYTRCEVM
jgi:hypothetical protein